MITRWTTTILLALALLLTPGGAALAQMEFSSPDDLAAKSGDAATLIDSAPPAGLSDQEWGSMQTQMQLAQYQFTWQTQNGIWAYRAPNLVNGLGLAFGYDGLTATYYNADGSASGQFGLRLRAYGEQTMPAAIPVQGLSAQRERVQYAWNAQVTEWYENTPKGVEHGLTLNTPPEAGATQLDFDLSGDLRAELDGDNGLILRTMDGAAVLHYNQLAVYDRNGKALRAQMMLIPGGMRITLDAAEAAYPLSVDPLLHTETAILRASDAQAGDYFGYSVATSGDVVVIGAYYEDGGAGNPHTDSGAAYVFLRDQGGTGNWGEAKILRASDGGCWFGISVAVSGDVIVVGASCTASGAGAAYVFERDAGGVNNWGQASILNASDGAAGDYFGSSVAASGDIIVVGAWNKNSWTGAAYIFERDPSWGQVKILSAPGAPAGWQFGVSVAASGDVIVIGAGYADSGSILDTGCAYVFQHDLGGTHNWGLAATLYASDPQTDDWFGGSVSISGDVIVIGAPFEDGGAGDLITDSGAAYIFQRNQGGTNRWEQAARLTASDPQADNWFGNSAAVSGGVIAVGAPNLGNTGPLNYDGEGATYVFQRDQNQLGRWGQAQILYTSDAQAGDRSGWSVAISGDVIVAGAPREDGASGALADAGAAYVFQRTQNEPWQQTALAHASDAQSEDYFGYSVAISGDVVVVGALYEDGGTGNPLNNTGAAYIFQREQGGASRWGETPTILRTPAAQVNDFFGASVAVSGDIIVVGAYGRNSGAGVTYVFQRDSGGANTWGLVTTLYASDAQAGDYFGYSVAVSGDVIVVGALYESGGAGDPLPGAGTAYVFQRNQGGMNNWGQVKILRASDAQASDDFGLSVAISGDVIVVGAPWEDSGGSDAGAAYVFQRDQGGMNNWGQVKILHASDAQASDYFGVSAAISGDVIVVGASNKNLSAGAAYVFQRDQGGSGQWGQVKILQASDAQASDRFGQSVAVSGNVLVVGTPWEDSGGSDAGAAYIFQRVQGGANNWGQVQKLAASDAQAGDWFGYSVAISGDVVIIGAIFEDGGAGDPISEAGAAYIFYFNNPPTAVNDAGASFTTDEATPFTTGSVLSNDSDPEGGSLSMSGFKASGLLGLLVNNGDGTFNYNPNGQFESLGVSEQAFETFVYTMTDGVAYDSAVVTIRINGVNDPLVAVDDQGAGFTTNEDTPITTGSVLANDIDIDGDSLSVNDFTAPGLPGTLTNNSNGTFNYNPNGPLDYLDEGDLITKTFIYTATDGLLSDSAVVTMTVHGVNDAPNAMADNFNVPGGSVNVLLDVLANDSDAEGHTLQILSVGAPNRGGTATNSGASISYTPKAGYAGIERFDYVISDGHGKTDSATVRVAVSGKIFLPLVMKPAAQQAGPEAAPVTQKATALALADMLLPGLALLKTNGRARRREGTVIK